MLNQDPPRFTRAFIFLMMALSFIVGAGAHKIWSEPSTERQAVALANTNQTQFKPLEGGAAIAAGHTPSPADLAEHVPAPIAKEIKHQGGTVTAVIQAQGTVPGGVSELTPVPTLPEPEGAFSGTAVQDRGGLPPLTSAHFAFDKTGLKVAWENETEVFEGSAVTARNADGSVHGFWQLIRKVKGRTETIAPTGADFYIPASEVVRLAPLPRLAIGLGIGRDALGRTRPNALIERPITRNSSFIAGYVNGGSLAMWKYSWGKQ